MPCWYLNAALVLLLLAACDAPLSVDHPFQRPAQDQEALRQDAQHYARDNGVPLDEAMQRLALQEEIGQLGARLEQQEAETFAGLWIQHQPVYRVIVAFTRDGEQTIAPYVAGSALEEVIEVRPAQTSYAELRAIQARLIDELEQAGLSFSSGINVQQNQVELYVTDPALFETALQQGQISVPPQVMPINVYEPLDEPPFPLTPEPTVHFPQLRVPSAAQMEALNQGTLVLEHGCLRVRASAGDPGHLIIWQPDYFLHRNGDQLEILDRSGTPVARVGEPIRLGGGEVPSGPGIERQLREPLPEACSGPLWLMGELLTDG